VSSKISTGNHGASSWDFSGGHSGAGFAAKDNKKPLIAKNQMNL